jgi:hypothetical protein
VDITDQASFQALSKLMKRRHAPLAFVGAGASRAAGYPDWPALLRLFDKRSEGKASPRYREYVRNLPDTAWQAEEYRRILGRGTFDRIVASTFAPQGSDGVGPVHRAIARLPFRHILTTNYDDCIERAHEDADRTLRVINWEDDEDLRQFFLNLCDDDTTRTLVYLHGKFTNAGDVVLSESSYSRRYLRSEDAQRKLFALLITQPVVFLGFSVNDPDLNHIMREVNARLGGRNGNHFAFTGYDGPEHKALTSSRFEGKFGIRPIFYEIKRNKGRGDQEDHGDLRRLLDELIGGTKKGSSSSRSVAKSPDSAPRVDPDDPQRGRWGGESTRNGRRLSAVLDREDRDEWCDFRLIVESVDPGAKRPLKGQVTFHLHDTYPAPDVTVDVVEGRAVYELGAWGAYTVGAETDGGETRLELDLSQLASFPKWFKER